MLSTNRGTTLDPARSRRSTKARLLSIPLSLALAVPMGGMPVAGAAQPDNDAFAAATTVPSLPYQDALSTAEATREAGEPRPPCGFRVGRTVWYSFTPGSDSLLAADTLGSRFDTVLSVWTGDSLGNLEAVVCNDDAFGVQSKVSFRALGGTTYHLQVGGYGGAGGSLNVRMREVNAGLIQGTVTDERSGAPIPGICVFVLDQDVDTFVETITNREGSFEIAARSGVYNVFLVDWCDRSDDYRPEWYEDIPPDGIPTPVEVTAPDITEIDVELERGCRGWGSFGDAHRVGTSARDTLVGTSGQDVICGRRGNDILRGFRGRDVLLGGPGRDRLFGGPGADLLIGGGGADRLFGGPGNDLLNGRAGRDVCTGGPGRDTAVRCEVVRGARIRGRSGFGSVAQLSTAPAALRTDKGFRPS